jgi:trigger factor
MKVESKKAIKCQVELNVSFEAAEVSEIVKKVERDFVSHAELPGFRKGKAPLDLIRKNFAAGIKDEVGKGMTARLPDAIKQAEIDAVAVYEVTDVKYDENGGTLNAIIDVKPEFKVPTYKGLKIELKDVTVTDEVLAAETENLKKMMAKYENAAEGDAIAAGDFVQIDYSGEIDGQSMAETVTADDAKVLAGGTNFWAHIEEGQFIPEILDALVGMKAGEEKSVKVKFAKKNVPEAVAGKKAVYSVKVKEFRKRVLPEDSEIYKLLDTTTKEEFETTYRNILQKRADEAETSRREGEVVEALLKRADFDLPKTIVNRAALDSFRAMVENAQSRGMSDEQIKAEQEKILASAMEIAEKQTRLFYIVDAIAEKEKIESNDQDRGKKVLEFILANVKGAK